MNLLYKCLSNLKKNMENVYEINFEENPEEYMEAIRAIKNLEIMFGSRRFFDDIQFYDPQPEPDLGYELGNELDIELINKPADDRLLSASTFCDKEVKPNKGIENK